MIKLISQVRSTTEQHGKHVTCVVNALAVVFHPDFKVEYLFYILGRSLGVICCGTSAGPDDGLLCEFEGLALFCFPHFMPLRASSVHYEYPASRIKGLPCFELLLLRGRVKLGPLSE